MAHLVLSFDVDDAYSDEGVGQLAVEFAELVSRKSGGHAPTIISVVLEREADPSVVPVVDPPVEEAPAAVVPDDVSATPVDAPVVLGDASVDAPVVI